MNVVKNVVCVLADITLIAQKSKSQSVKALLRKTSSYGAKYLRNKKVFMCAAHYSNNGSQCVPANENV